jgi:hypothetical protein
MPRIAADTQKAIEHRVSGILRRSGRRLVNARHSDSMLIYEDTNRQIGSRVYMDCGS